jgi:hypothetical protein
MLHSVQQRRIEIHKFHTSYFPRTTFVIMEKVLFGVIPHTTKAEVSPDLKEAAMSIDEKY